MSRVVLENVSKVYPGGIRAVDDVSLTIGEGEFLVLVGPSGCGKSTMLRMVAGLEAMTSGRIWIGDRDTDGVAPKDRDVAMVFQNDALYPHLTVRENMAFGLRLRGIGRAERDKKVCEASGLLGISALLDRNPATLSGGQRQRVAMGRAIVRRPEVFLLDEPLSNLDAGLRVEMREVVKAVHRRVGTTTIYVTHDQEEAIVLGDRVAVLKEGAVQQCAVPADVYDHPANRFVGGFFGTPSMNFLDGRIVVEGDAWYFDEGSCRIGLVKRFGERLARFKDKKVILGIRPEHLSAQKNGGAGGEKHSLAMTVNRIERLGDRWDVIGQTPSHNHVVCRVDTHSGIREGQSMAVFPDLERIHFFEPGEAGVNVSLNGSGASISAN